MFVQILAFVLIWQLILEYKKISSVPYIHHAKYCDPHNINLFSLFEMPGVKYLGSSYQSHTAYQKSIQ